MSPDPFPQTRWSLVLAGPRAEDPERQKAALEELARSYWKPAECFGTARPPEKTSCLPSG